MKKILTTLSILAITITVGNVNNVNLNSSWQQNVHIIIALSTSINFTG
ncbi:hypothetical protein [Spiroplasma endosymbiont of Colias croceus]